VQNGLICRWLRLDLTMTASKKKFTVTSLDAPHRVADAILRDSLLDGVIFRLSEQGKLLDTADVRNATGLFGLNPTALVFGIWDSTGPRGGLGAKFQRALVSEIIGFHAHGGVKTSSRIDPAQIMLGAGPVYERAEKNDNMPSWTLDAALASKDKNQPKKLGKDGKPSEANHSSVTHQLPMEVSHFSRPANNRTVTNCITPSAISAE